MYAAFAETFCGIAFTNVQDLALEMVKALTRSEKPDVIITTEEVLIEYLNYFTGWGSRFRSKVGCEEIGFSVVDKRDMISWIVTRLGRRLAP
jgi:hypothetical protein